VGEGVLNQSLALGLGCGPEGFDPNTPVEDGLDFDEFGKTDGVAVPTGLK
jgi:hypothetical protein